MQPVSTQRPWPPVLDISQINKYSVNNYFGNFILKIYPEPLKVRTTRWLRFRIPWCMKREDGSEKCTDKIYYIICIDFIGRILGFPNGWRRYERDVSSTRTGDVFWNLIVRDLQIASLWCHFPRHLKSYFSPKRSIFCCKIVSTDKESVIIYFQS